MELGLVLGKFMPLHEGHIELIDFSLQYCDRLIVLICASDKENISGQERKKWLDLIYSSSKKVDIVLFEYNESEYPNTSASSVEVARIWADLLKSMFPHITTIFSSEPYGDYVANFMDIRHRPFDLLRSRMPISSSQIRANPYQYWDFLPKVVKPYFVKKVCIAGTESSGKTSMVVQLAQHFTCDYVSEVARDIVKKTSECTYQHLYKIAEQHALSISKALLKPSKLLIVDTDLTITMSYAKFLFNKELIIPEWIKNLNMFDLYLYLDKEVPYIQDGTRLSFEDRNMLDQFHRTTFAKRKILLHEISGNWNQRLTQAIDLIDQLVNDNEG